MSEAAHVLQLSSSRNPHRGRHRDFRACISLMALAPALAVSAPLVFEETAKILSPVPGHEFPIGVAVEGDTIIATGRTFDGPIEHHDVFLFRRDSNGTWTYVRTLARNSCDSSEAAEDTCNASVAIRNGVAVVSAGQLHVFTRAADGSWVAAPASGFSGPGDAAVGTGAVFTSESNGCTWSSQAFRRNAAGQWSLAATFPGPSFPCDPWGLLGSDIDVSAGNRLIVGNSDYVDDAHIYEPNGSTWAQTAVLTSPVNAIRFGGSVAIDDSRAFVSGTMDMPIHVFARATGSWQHAANIVPPDSLQHGPPRAIRARDLVAAGFAFDPDRSGSVRLFRANSTNQYEQVAKLVGSDAGARQLYLGERMDAYVSGSFARVVASGGGALYVFDLNRWGTTPAPRQEDFEAGNAVNWTSIAGSSFAVVASGGSHVYRQSSLMGDAGSFVTGIDWTNQGIEADVKPTAFDGSNRWVGLAVRRTDASNYYYVTLRQSNVLELKRMLNGAFVTLASHPIQVALHRTTRLRIEAIGTLIRVYVNGRRALQVHDSSLARGHAGLLMYKARADFDNVVLSQNPQVALLDQRAYAPIEQRWDMTAGVWSASLDANNNQRLVQQDLSGDARAVALVQAQDQIVQAQATATSFASGTGSRWFGLMARYIDANNYYYVTLRSDQTISLRKLVNGAIHVLDSAPLTVAAGTTYAIRLEAVGSSLRAYVNGNLVLEASDTTHARGRYGPVMYKAAATYADVLTWEP